MTFQSPSHRLQESLLLVTFLILTLSAGAQTLPLVPDVEESRIGGSFKTRILKPLSDVTFEDVA